MTYDIDRLIIMVTIFKHFMKLCKLLLCNDYFVIIYKKAACKKNSKNSMFYNSTILRGEKLYYIIIGSYKHVITLY